MLKFPRLASLLILAGFSFPMSGFAMATYWEEGVWPESWPQELDVLRARSFTCVMATGTQEHIYSIPFRSHEEFRRLWPSLRSLASTGAPITLRRMGATDGKSPGWDFTGPMVQIFAPSGGITGASPMRDTKGRQISDERFELGMRMGQGETLTDEELAVLDPDSLRDDDVIMIDTELLAELETRGETLRSCAPWPAHLYDENGALPEYVQSETVHGKLRWRSADEIERRGFMYRCRVEIVLYVDGDVIDPDALNLPRTLVLVDER